MVYIRALLRATFLLSKALSHRKANSPNKGICSRFVIIELMDIGSKTCPGIEDRMNISPIYRIGISIVYYNRERLDSDLFRFLAVCFGVITIVIVLVHVSIQIMR